MKFNTTFIDLLQISSYKFSPKSHHCRPFYLIMVFPALKCHRQPTFLEKETLSKGLA